MQFKIHISGIFALQKWSISHLKKFDVSFRIQQYKKESLESCEM